MQSLARCLLLVSLVLPGLAQPPAERLDAMAGEIAEATVDSRRLRQLARELEPLRASLAEQVAEAGDRADGEATRAATELLQRADTLAADLATRQEIVGETEALAALEAEAATEGHDLERLRDLLERAGQAREASRARLTQREPELARVTEELAALGQPLAGETADLRATRARLTQQQTRLEQSLAAARLHELRAQRLVDELQRRLQTEATGALLRREARFDQVVGALFLEAVDWPAFGQRLVTRGLGLQGRAPGGWLLAGLLVALATGLGWWLRGLARQAAAATALEPLANRLLRSLLASAAVHLPWLLPVAAATALLGRVETPDGGRPALATVGAGLVLYLLLRLVNRTFLAPYPPAEAALPFEREFERRLARRLAVLPLILAYGYVLLTTGERLETPVPLFRLGRCLFVVLLALDLGWLVRLPDQLAGRARVGRWLRDGTLAALAVAVGAELLGYLELSLHLLGALAGTLLLRPLLWLVLRLAGELLDALEQGRRGVAEPLRRWFGLSDDQPLPGVGWLRFAGGLVVWCGAALALLRLWSSASGYHALLARLRQGWSVGGLVLPVDRVLVGLLVFSLLMTASLWGREALRRALAAGSRLDSGARDAVATMAGYGGFAVAALVGAGAIGLDMTKLAVVAGALSVGLGFGLQNIVNNFVSGLILLFERPIKVGDWIRVGGAEGYVRQLSVRSTQLQTFDLEEVIIPNSELISEHVVNFTRQNVLGRVIIPVGVAYGSDTERVKQILLEVARAHPEMATGPAAADYPLVLFRAFGESALEFELRCVVQQVNRRLAVASDLLFEIDRRFRAEGIVIPFPQRDVWLRGRAAE